jgi:hypothetical protein
MDVIKDDGYDTLEDFTNMLNKNLCYNFILIHHSNKNIVNYSSQFGDEYKKLCLAFVRDKNSLSEIEYESIEDVLKFKEFKNIAISKGFLLVSSSPLTRSSYHADEDFAQLQKNKLEKYNAQSLS